MVSAGDEVRAYNSPTDLYVVVETDVDRDVSVPDSSLLWRLPSGDTLIRNAEREGLYMVVKEELVYPA